MRSESKGNELLSRIVSAAIVLMVASCASEEQTDPADEVATPQAVAMTSPYAWKTLNGRPPAIIAHRGASGYLPEHTLEAYEMAIDQGADMIEPDLVMTKDGVLVARHDRYLSTTTDVADHPAFAGRRRPDPDPNGEGRTDWWVEDFTLEELKRLRARQPREGRPRAHDDRYGIPTFDEILVLATVRAQQDGRPIGIYPETKHPDYFASIGLEFEPPLLNALNSYDAGPVYIQSFEPEILKRLSGKTSAMLVQLVFEATPGAGPNVALKEIASYADGVGPSKTLLIGANGCATGFVADAHRKALFVHPWTFRDDAPIQLPRADSACVRADLSDPMEEMKHVFQMGVDGVFADFPDTAIAARADFTR